VKIKYVNLNQSKTWKDETMTNGYKLKIPDRLIPFKIFYQMLNQIQKKLSCKRFVAVNSCNHFDIRFRFGILSTQLDDLQFSAFDTFPDGVHCRQVGIVLIDGVEKLTDFFITKILKAKGRIKISKLHSPPIWISS